MSIRWIINLCVSIINPYIPNLKQNFHFFTMYCIMTLMDFEDKDIYALIEKIGVHYNQNVANRYIRPVLGAVLAESEFSGDCTALTERFEQYQYQGYYLDDLYRQILALFKLCEKIEKISLPDLRNQAAGVMKGISSEREKVIRDIAVNNLPYNISILKEMLASLFAKAKQEDSRMNNGTPAVMNTIPGIVDLEKFQ